MNIHSTLIKAPKTTNMKTIFITGASTVLSYATARLFGENGWKVIDSMRQPETVTELAALHNTILLPPDITDPEQISKTVAMVTAMGNIDLVFNNAGYGLIDPPEATTDDQILRQINTNLLGVIRTTKAFIPHFRTRGSGLFISASSAHHATKWALEGWSESMAFELKRFGIGIKTVAPEAIASEAVVPGGIATGGIAPEAIAPEVAGCPLDQARSEKLARSEAYDGPMSKVWNAFAGMFTHSSAEQIAAVVYEAATDGKDQLRYVAEQPAPAGRVACTLLKKMSPALPGFKVKNFLM
jgi:NAD(P)-dependent dehydrogenase (short-subunit alcohol dehydrogenase family)